MLRMGNICDLRLSDLSHRGSQAKATLRLREMNSNVSGLLKLDSSLKDHRSFHFIPTRKHDRKVGPPLNNLALKSAPRGLSMLHCRHLGISNLCLPVLAVYNPIFFFDKIVVIV